MKFLIYKSRRDTSARPITERDPLTYRDIEGLLYHVRVAFNHGDKADDTAANLAVEHVKGDIYRSKLPKQRSLIQIEGVVSEAWFPRVYTNGDIQIYGAERIRYQTLRDGILYTPVQLKDAMLIDMEPYLVLNPETTYRLPKREGRFYLGPNFIVGEGDYHVRGTEFLRGYGSRPYDAVVLMPGGAYARSAFTRYDFRTYSFSLPSATKKGSLGPVTDGWTKWKLEIDWTSPTAPARLTDEEQIRLKTVIDTLTDLHHNEDVTADATWLLRCGVSGRSVEEYVYFNGKPKGVYAKEISST